MSAQTLITNKYGVPSADYRKKHCIMWDIIKDFHWCENIKVGASNSPFKRIYINKDFKAKITSAFLLLEKEGIHTEIKTYDGCYVDRQVRGRNAKSLHSWAMAIDFNASVEKLGQENTNWSDKFISIMNASGLYWGGVWKRPDNMHFALYNG